MKLKQQTYFEKVLLKHAYDRDLHSLAAVARYLNYDAACFRQKAKLMTFRWAELKRIFLIMKFTDEEILEVMK